MIEQSSDCQLRGQSLNYRRKCQGLQVRARQRSSSLSCHQSEIPCTAQVTSPSLSTASSNPSPVFAASTPHNPNRLEQQVQSDPLLAGNVEQFNTALLAIHIFMPQGWLVSNWPFLISLLKRFRSSIWDPNLSYLECSPWVPRPLQHPPWPEQECDPWYWLQWYHPGSQARPSDRQQALYCLHQLSYWGDGEAPQHVPDGLHPVAGDSTGVQSVQYSNLLLLRLSWVEWMRQLAESAYPALEVMQIVSGRGFITQLIFLRYVLSCLHLLTIMPNSGAQVPAFAGQTVSGESLALSWRPWCSPSTLRRFCWGICWSRWSRKLFRNGEEISWIIVCI